MRGQPTLPAVTRRAQSARRSSPSVAAAGASPCWARSCRGCAAVAPRRIELRGPRCVDRLGISRLARSRRGGWPVVPLLVSLVRCVVPARWSPVVVARPPMVGAGRWLAVVAVGSSSRSTSAGGAGDPIALHRRSRVGCTPASRVGPCETARHGRVTRRAWRAAGGGAVGVGGHDRQLTARARSTSRSTAGRSVMIPSTPRSSRRSISAGSSMVHTCTCDAQRVRSLDEPAVDDREPALPHRHLRGQRRRRRAAGRTAARRRLPGRARCTARRRARPRSRRMRRSLNAADAHSIERAAPAHAATSAGAAASDLQSMLTRRSGHVPSRSSSSGIGASPSTSAVLHLAPRQLADPPGPTAGAAAGRRRGTPPARRRPSPARRSRRSGSPGRRRTRTPASCSRARRWHHRGGRTGSGPSQSRYGCRRRHVVHGAASIVAMAMLRHDHCPLARTTTRSSARSRARTADDVDRAVATAKAALRDDAAAAVEARRDPRHGGAPG